MNFAKTKILFITIIFLNCWSKGGTYAFAGPKKPGVLQAEQEIADYTGLSEGLPPSNARNDKQVLKHRVSQFHLSDHAPAISFTLAVSTVAIGCVLAFNRICGFAFVDGMHILKKVPAPKSPASKMAHLPATQVADKLIEKVTYYPLDARMIMVRENLDIIKNNRHLDGLFEQLARISEESATEADLADNLTKFFKTEELSIWAEKAHMEELDKALEKLERIYFKTSIENSLWIAEPVFRANHGLPNFHTREIDDLKGFVGNYPRSASINNDLTNALEIQYAKAVLAEKLVKKSADKIKYTGFFFSRTLVFKLKSVFFRSFNVKVLKDAKADPLIRRQLFDDVIWPYMTHYKKHKGIQSRLDYLASEQPKEFKALEDLVFEYICNQRNLQTSRDALLRLIKKS